MPRRESRFFCVTDEGLPRGTTALLREACRRRNVRYAEVPASSFDYDQGRRLNPGDLLYCAAATQEARRVEQFLHARGVVTFYSGGDGIYYDCSNPELLLERAGLPTPRSLACVAADHDLLRRQADQLGGFPLVMKFPGWWKGVGVVRVDSMPSLISLVDFALAPRRGPGALRVRGRCDSMAGDGDRQPIRAWAPQPDPTG